MCMPALGCTATKLSEVQHAELHQIVDDGPGERLGEGCLLPMPLRVIAARQSRGMGTWNARDDRSADRHRVTNIIRGDFRPDPDVAWSGAVPHEAPIGRKPPRGPGAGFSVVFGASAAGLRPIGPTHKNRPLPAPHGNVRAWKLKW
jgi:hypothetical protein